MSKRIFSDDRKIPNCYYHQQPITHFCTKKKCTLPLCEVCLPIHKRQHVNAKQIAMDGIVEFQKARSEALNAFSARKKELLEIQQNFINKVQEYQQKIVNIVVSTLSSFNLDSLINDGNIQILRQIQERSSEIKNGSLKQMIRYYEDTYGAEHFRKLYKMYFGDYLNNFKFKVDQKRVEEIVKKGIINTALKQVEETDKGQQNTVQHDKVKQQPKVEEISQNSEYHPTSLHQTMLQNFEQNKQKQRIEHEYYTISINEQRQSIKEEQEEQSQISSYQMLKSRKHRQTNLYTQPAEKVSLPLSSFPSSYHTSQTNRSNIRRKKGLSLVKSHQQLSSIIKQPFKSVEHSAEIEVRQKKSPSWRNFVDMGGPTTHRQPPRLRQIRQQKTTTKYEQKPILDPRQMRQMIVKKKHEQKHKERSSIPNKSSEKILVPSKERVH